MQQTGFNRLLAGLFFIGASVGVYFQFAYHKFLNNDTLSYINLAERYAAGDWQHAINGFWSPLYSWILCFCKLAGLPFLPCCYIINFLVAGLGLYVLCKLAQRYITTPVFYYTFNCYLLLLLLFYAMSALTPDLMAAVFCLWFLLLVTDQRFEYNKQMPWWAGVIAACAFFAKLYSFVPMHLFMGSWLLLLLVKNRSFKSKKLILLIKAYGLFILLSSSWIVAISLHEGKPVITTAGPFNHYFVSPDYGKGFPTDEGLYAPPFNEAYSAHINPAHSLDQYDWSPFSNARNFNYQVNLIKASVRKLIMNLDGTGAKWLILLFSLLVLAINRKKPVKENCDRSIHKIAWFFVCYPLLYLPLFILDRYILTCIILFHLLLFFAAQRAWNLVNKKLFTPVFVLLLLLSVYPFLTIGYRKLTQASGDYQYQKSFYQQLPQLSFLKDQSIAVYPTAMVEATQLCYYFHCRNFSTWTDKQYQSLKKFNIRYLVSKRDLSEYPFLLKKKKLFLVQETVYIYEIQ
ncbi:MAG: hypothetical protein ACJ751_14800 [Niastella sp.]|uniref:hypothetical protein n=1 Tax=Niastella sp. TaxID=1869183 RepID=UPI003899AD3B